MDSFKNVKDEINYSEDGILSKELWRTEAMDVTLFSMAEGTEISDHTSSKEGIVYVIEGDGEFVLEGETIEMKPGVTIYITKKAVHSLKANKDTSFILALKD